MRTSEPPHSALMLLAIGMPAGSAAMMGAGEAVERSDQRRQGNGAGHHWEVRLWGPRDVLPIPSSPTITAYPGQAVLGGDAPPALNFLVVVVNRGQNTGPAVSPRPSGRSWPSFSRLLGDRPFDFGRASVAAG